MITDKEKQQGFSVCKDCDSGIHLLQSGFDVETHICALCKKDVADRDEFFGVGVEVLGKD